MFSDHKPVVGIYEATLLPPLILNTDIKNPDGLLKFTNIKFSFDISLF